MMNGVLRCNRRAGDQVCRRELLHEAYVTTCSHIFCRECVQEQRFTDQAKGRRQCLACEIALPEAEDVVRTHLRPRAEHLSTILCGFTPEMIMDCAKKAITFWNYQMLTELAWQEHLVQRWMNKYNGLRTNASKVIEEANGEIAHLQEQVNALAREREGAQRHANDLAERLSEKNAAQDKLQTLYNNLKTKVQTDQARNAAANITPHVQPLNAPRSHQSLNDAQFDAVSLPPLLTSRKQQRRHPIDEHDVEVLHPFQRSGSARGPTSSELAAQGMMPPPPLRSNAKDSLSRASLAATPAQRISLNRNDRNHTFPQASTRQPASQHFPVQSFDRQAAQGRTSSQSQCPRATSQIVKTPARMVANRSLY